MDIKTNFAPSAEPMWKSIIVKSKLPAELACLHEISRNIWWVWNYEATELFNEIDSHNVVFLYLRFEQKGVLRIVRTRVNEESKIKLI